MDENRWRQRIWKAVKWAVVIAILAAVGKVFYDTLTDDSWDGLPADWQPGWLIIGGAAYLMALTVSSGYWWITLLGLGQRAGLLATLRAGLISHLGKYVPGKAALIIIRASLLRGPGLRVPVIVLTVFIETLVLMAAGALLASVFIALRTGGEDVQIWQALLLLGMATVPVMPFVFNPVARFATQRFLRKDSALLPPLRSRTIFVGLAVQLLSWPFQGLSLWAVSRAIHPMPFELSPILDCTAVICIATVAGFFTPLPGGLGIREFLIMKLLAGSLGGEAPAAVAALLLRLLTAGSEIVIAAVLYPLPWLSSRRSGMSEETGEHVRPNM